MKNGQTAFQWDGTMQNIQENVTEENIHKFIDFKDYFEIHSDNDVYLLDKGDYVLFDPKTNHFSDCSAKYYQTHYAKANA